MRNLPPEVLRKAVEMANAMLREGMDEGQAIRIATAKAQKPGRADSASRPGRMTAAEARCGPARCGPHGPARVDAAGPSALGAR